MPCLPCFLNGRFQILIPLLLHIQQLIFPLQSGIFIQTGCHHQKNHIKTDQKDKQGDAKNDVPLKNPADIKCVLIAWNHKKITYNEDKWQNPEHIPCPGKIVIFHHCTCRIGSRIIRSCRRKPADSMIKDTCPQAEPWLWLHRLSLDQDNRIDCSGQTVHTGKQCTDRKCDRSGFPNGDPKHFDIQNDHNQYNQYKHDSCGNMKMPAEYSSTDTKAQHQWHLPQCKLSRRLL